MTSVISWANVTLANLLVSLQVPVGWSMGSITEETCELEGPTADGYTPTVSLQAGEPEEPGHDWFDSFADSIVPHLSGNGSEFQLLHTDRFRLSSVSADVFAVQARWVSDEPDVPPTSQLQAWIWAGSTRMLVFGGSTLFSSEDEDLPIFDHMLRSIRLLPPKP